MNFRENTGGYESMIWLQDRNGREFACYREDVQNPSELREEEKANCLDVSNLIGTERW